MLKTSAVYEGIGKLNDVNTDFIERLTQLRNKDGLVDNVGEVIFRWSLESKS